MGRLVVVGSGTVVPEGDRGGACFYVELADARLLLDCGPGAVQSAVRQGVAWSRLTDVVLTHFHTDHVGGLPALFFAFKHGLLPAHRERDLDVWGPEGTRRLFMGLAAALGDFFLSPGFPVHLHELTPGDSASPSEGVRLSVHDTPHTEESVAVRLEGPGVSLGYTGDTGPSDTLGSFFRGVDLLIAECSLRDEEVGDNHLSPARVARLAREAGPARLVLTHVYPHLRELDLPAIVREAGFSDGEILVARDGLELPLTGR